MSFCSWRQAKIVEGSGWPAAASASSTFAPVVWLPVLVLREAARPCSWNSTSLSCLGEPRLKRAPGQPVGLLLELGHAREEVGREVLQHLAIDPDAAPLHGRQHRDQRPLEGLVHPRAALARDGELEQPVQPQGHVGRLGGVGGGPGDRRPIERDAVPAAAADGLVGCGLPIEMQARQLRQAMAVAGAVQDVG